MEYLKNDWGIDNVTSIEHYEGYSYVKIEDTESNLYAVIPDDLSQVDSATVSFLLHPNSKNGQYKNIQEYYNQNTPESIFVFVDENVSYNNWDITYKNTKNIIESIENSTEVKIDSITDITFSRSGLAGLNCEASMIEDKSLSGSQLVITLDPSTADIGNGGHLIGYSSKYENYAQTLADNDTVLFIYEGPGGIDAAQNNGYATLAKFGIKIIAVENKSCNDHIEVKYNAINDGIFELSAGDLSVLDNWEKSENYTFVTYDENGNKLYINAEGAKQILSECAVFNSGYYSYTPSEAYYSNANFAEFDAKINDLKNLDTIKSDSEVVNEFIGQIRTMIKGSNILNNIDNKSTTMSTTKVPTAARDYLYRYVASVTSLLEKIEQETRSICSVANSIDKVDVEIKSEIEDSNESIEAPVIQNSPNQTKPSQENTTTNNTTSSTNTPSNSTTNQTKPSQENITTNNTTPSTNTSSNSTTNQTKPSQENTTTNNTTPSTNTSSNSTTNQTKPSQENTTTNNTTPSTNAPSNSTTNQTKPTQENTTTNNTTPSINVPSNNTTEENTVNENITEDKTNTNTDTNNSMDSETNVDNDTVISTPNINNGQNTSQSEKNQQNNNILKTIGATAALGGAIGAAAYGAKTYLDSRSKTKDEEETFEKQESKDREDKKEDNTGLDDFD